MNYCSSSHARETGGDVKLQHNTEVAQRPQSVRGQLSTCLVPFVVIFELNCSRPTAPARCLLLRWLCTFRYPWRTTNHRLPFLRWPCLTLYLIRFLCLGKNF